jgi:hypothetical protein
MSWAQTACFASQTRALLSRLHGAWLRALRALVWREDVRMCALITPSR